MNIEKKIWFILGMLLFIYFSFNAFGYVNSKKNEARLINVSEYVFQASRHSQAALTLFKEMVNMYQDAVMMGDTTILDNARKKVDSVRQSLEDILALKGINLKTKELINNFLKEYDQYSNSAHTVYKAESTGDDSAGTGKLTELAEQSERFQTQLTDLTQSFVDELQFELSEVNDDSKRQRQYNIFIIVSMIIVAFIVLIVVRRVTQSINLIVDSLNEGANQVDSSSDQISSASQLLAEASSEQAASIEETSSSLEEMSSMTKQNADNAGQADNLMKEANQVVVEANNSMAELTLSMEEISKASEETSKIIKTIDEIAFQTNLLALNAAVEAARAGEAGAGFAVVADEVRNLAMRAADAAKNTSELIEGTVKRITKGSELVSKTDDAFRQVAESAGKVGGLVGEIAAASNEQAQGIEQVNKAVSSMDKVVQDNAANAEESAGASEEMSAQANQMKNIVDELDSLVSGVGKNNRLPEASGYRKSSLPKTQHTRTSQKSKNKQLVNQKNIKLNPGQIIPMDDDFQDF